MKKIIIHCIDCGAQRAVFTQNASKVKRCKPHQDLVASKSRHERKADRKKARRLMEESGVARVCVKCGSRKAWLRFRVPLGAGGKVEIGNLFWECRRCP